MVGSNKTQTSKETENMCVINKICIAASVDCTEKSQGELM